jgi:hypothetical protein
MIDTTSLEIDRLVYLRNSTDDNVEPTKIIFEFDAGPTVDDFKIICMRMAAALGYDEELIKSSFGTIPDDVICEETIKKINI